MTSLDSLYKTHLHGILDAALVGHNISLTADTIFTPEILAILIAEVKVFVIQTITTLNRSGLLPMMTNLDAHRDNLAVSYLYGYLQAKTGQGIEALFSLRAAPNIPSMHEVVQYIIRCIDIDVQPESTPEPMSPIVMSPSPIPEGKKTRTSDSSKVKGLFALKKKSKESLSNTPIGGV